VLKAQKFIPLLVMAAGLWVYHNSLQGVFLFDEMPALCRTPRFAGYGPCGRRCPTTCATVEGRPLVNLSLAINYAFGGIRVWVITR